jgi:hypothetical protein
MARMHRVSRAVRSLDSLASLVPASFDLDATPPTATAQGAYTKNKPRLENHAHAAAGDRFQQLVVAEIGNPAQRRILLSWGRLGRLRETTLRRPEGCGRQPHAVVVGEEGPQVRRQVGVPGQQFLAFRRLPGIDGVQVRRDDFLQASRVGGRG